MPRSVPPFAWGKYACEWNGIFKPFGKKVKRKAAHAAITQRKRRRLSYSIVLLLSCTIVQHHDNDNNHQHHCSSLHTVLCAKWDLRALPRRQPKYQMLSQLIDQPEYVFMHTYPITLPLLSTFLELPTDVNLCLALQSSKSPLHLT